MSNEKNYYKELTLFNDIANPTHRAWNRRNLRNDGRGRDAKGYLDKLSQEGRAAIGLLVLAIQKKGLDTVKAEINRSIA